MPGVGANVVQGYAMHPCVVGSQIGIAEPQSPAPRHSTQRPVMLSQRGLVPPQLASDRQDTQRPTQRLQIGPDDEASAQELLFSSQAMQNPRSASQ